MLFQLKKIVGALALPIPLILFLIACGLILLCLRRCRPLAILLVTSGWALLLLMSLPLFSQLLLKPLESQSTTWNGHLRPEYIVVLGNSYTWQPDWAPSSNLSSTSLYRVTEAIRQWQRFPTSTLIFTGARSRHNPKSNAWVAAKVAKSLGVPASHIKILTTPKDTQQEAAEVKLAIGQARFLLVTSASHMPRALAVFNAAGLHAIAVPANQLAQQGPLNLEQKYIPQGFWLAQSEKAWYEYLGDAWLWLNHLAQPAPPTEDPQQN